MMQILYLLTMFSKVMVIVTVLLLADAPGKGHDLVVTVTRC